MSRAADSNGAFKLQFRADPEGALKRYRERGYHVEDDLKRGTLIQVLANHPPSRTPVSLLYPRNRQLSPRVRVFIDWLVRAFG